MLPNFIIDEIQRRERERTRDDRPQPRLEIPPPDSVPPPDIPDAEESARGYAVIELL